MPSIKAMSQKTAKLYDDMIKDDLMSDIIDSVTKIDQGLYDATALIEDMAQAENSDDLDDRCDETIKLVNKVNKEYLAFLELSQKLKEGAGKTISGFLTGVQNIKRESDSINYEV